MAEEQSTGKSFFHTLPGIITAIAGLITAVGGFILILNKAGCISAKTNDPEQHIVAEDTTANNEDDAVQDSLAEGDFYYTPDTVKHITRYLVYTIEEASTETLPNGVIVLNVKLKCVNNSDYEYPFYSTYLGVRINGDRYSPDPYSPSGNYNAVPARHLKELEYNFKLPKNIKNFELVFYDLEEEIGSSTFTLK